MTPPVIDLDGVTLRRNGKTLLKDISWTVSPGEHWALLGRNGSGKTLTLKMISGLIWPSEGSISVLGHKFGSYDLRELRKEIGWVSLDLQYQYQRGFPVKNVVLSGAAGTIALHEKPSSSLLESVQEQLEKFGLQDLSENEFHTLSYGEQKKVIIARAMLSKPKLLILDEPMTGLDLRSREDFLQTIQELGSDTSDTAPSIIYVSHHIEELMPFISHVMLLKSGEVVSSGLKEEVLMEELLSDCLEISCKVQSQNERYLLEITS